MKERDCTFDIMKGVAMVLVITCHTAPWMSYSFAYWRSAMFFVISGYFAKEWPIGEFLRNGAKRLFIPYVVTCLVMLMMVPIVEKVFEINLLSTVLKSIALGAGKFGYDDEWNDICIGPLWFVCASTWVRIMWALFQKIQNLVIRGVVIVLFAIGACKLKEFAVNPWSILSAFGALGFFYAGYVIRNCDLLKSEMGKRIMPLASLCLVYCIYCSDNSMKLDINAGFYEKGYLIELFAGVGAFMLLYSGVQRFANIKYYPWRFLNFLGRYSLIAFCVHSIDFCFSQLWIPFKFWDWFQTDFELICAHVLRVGIIAVCVYLISKNAFLRERIFFIR